MGPGLEAPSSPHSALSSKCEIMGFVGKVITSFWLMQVGEQAGVRGGRKVAGRQEMSLKRKLSQDYRWKSQYLIIVLV